jgi:hypothetical protein
MSNIAPHCLPGGHNHEGHEPCCAWPADCYVQWGSKGIVFRRDGGKTYQTAFFEAFPQTFIRGEGATVADAERSAFAQFQRFQACAGHEFERRGYTNGAGFCKHCGMFKSKVFAPTTTCSVCSEPTDYSYGVDADKVAHWYCENHESLRPRDTQPSFVDRLRLPEAGSV